MGAHKHKCCKCGQRHAKPTGAKCEWVAAELNELQGDVKALLQSEDGMEGCPGDIEESSSNGEGESWQDGVQKVRDELKEGLSMVNERLAGIERLIAAVAGSVEGNGGNRPKAKHAHSKGTGGSSSRESRGHRRQRCQSSWRLASSLSTESSQDRDRRPTTAYGVSDGGEKKIFIWVSPFLYVTLTLWGN